MIMVTVICIVYIAGLLSLFALRAFLPHWPSWLALINAFVPWLFAPLVILLPLALLAQSEEALVSCMGSAVLFAVLYGPRFLPRIRRTIASTDNTLSVMTFNLGNDNTFPDQLAAVLDREQADIVAVQEYSLAVVDLLRERYPYAILDPGKSTSGLLSCYPIVAHAWFKPAGSGRSAIDATLEVKGKLLHVLAVHLYPPDLAWHGDWPVGLHDQHCASQVEDLVRRVTASEGSVLMLGDFNMNDQSRAYVMLSRSLGDAYREAGWGFGFTFPNGWQVAQVSLPWPLVRIDYIFHSDDLHVERARVARQGGSDHCYVVARLTDHRQR